MPDEPIGGVTVDTSLLEPEANVPPAPEPTESGQAARPSEEGSTTSEPLSAEELHEQLSRERARAEKAEKAVREQQSRAAKLQRENQQARERELKTVEDQIAQINNRLDQGESLTLEELRRRDQLMEQKITLRLNQRDAAEHNQRRVEYATKLQDLAMKDMNMDAATYQDFLSKHAVPVFDPSIGLEVLTPFGNYNDPEAAYNAAVAFLHYETRGQYEDKTRQAATLKADELARQKLRQSLPGGASPKQQPPADPQQAYKDAINAVGQKANPDSWF